MSNNIDYNKYCEIKYENKIRKYNMEIRKYENIKYKINIVKNCFCLYINKIIKINLAGFV